MADFSGTPHLQSGLAGSHILGALLAILLLSFLALDVLTLYSLRAACSTVCCRPPVRPACIRHDLKPSPRHSARAWLSPKCRATINGKYRLCRPPPRPLPGMAGPRLSTKDGPPLPRAGKPCKPSRQTATAPASTRRTRYICTWCMPIRLDHYP